MNRQIKRFIHNYSFLAAFVIVFVITAVFTYGGKLVSKASDKEKTNAVAQNQITQIVTQMQSETILEEETGEVETADISDELEATESVTEQSSVVSDGTYLSDALFIGDSRIEYLKLYATDLLGATFWDAEGLDLQSALSAQIAKVAGTTTSLEKGLQSITFGKIYIQLGINDIGTGSDSWWAGLFADLVNEIRMYQPNAIIYIMGIQHQTNAKGPDWVNPTIDARNAMISQLADNSGIFYINSNVVTDDGAGGLNPEYTNDGVHTTAKYVSLVSDYIINNAK